MPHQQLVDVLLNFSRASAVLCGPFLHLAVQMTHESSLVVKNLRLVFVGAVGQPYLIKPIHFQLPGSGMSAEDFALTGALRQKLDRIGQNG